MTEFENETWMPPVAYDGDEPLTLAELRAIDEGALTVPESRITDKDREEMGWPTESDREEMEAWRAVAALETALNRLETGELLSDCDGEIIAIKRPDGKGFGIWAGDQVTSTNVPAAKEAAELLGGVR